MDETLQFIVMVDSQLYIPQIVEGLLELLEGSERRKANSLDVAGNWIEIWSNDDADESLANGPNRHWNFRFRLESTPLTETISEDHQVETAKSICDGLQQLDCDVVLCANFEARLPQFGPHEA